MKLFFGRSVLARLLPVSTPAILAARHEATETAFRQGFTMPALRNDPVDSVRLNRIADEALRAVRRAAAADPGFTWLLAPRVAAGFLAMAIAGGAVGANWPLAQAAQPADTVALLDIPLAATTDVSP